MPVKGKAVVVEPKTVVGSKVARVSRSKGSKAVDPFQTLGPSRKTTTSRSDGAEALGIQKQRGRAQAERSPSSF